MIEVIPTYVRTVSVSFTKFKERYCMKHAIQYEVERTKLNDGHVCQGVHDGQLGQGVQVE